MIPYGKQIVDRDDVAAVLATLESDWLTTGPKVSEFETAVAQFCGASQGVAIANGTAALHAAYAALGVGPGDEVIVPTMTFAATANAAVYLGATPIFADVSPDTLLIDPAKVEALVTTKTRAIVGVDYGGQPCNWDALSMIAKKHRLATVADGAHAIGGEWSGRRVGTLADLTTFSFHPVKHITTGEGGMIMTHNAELAAKMRVFRNHGIVTDTRQREEKGTFEYEMVSLGYNYRLSDIQCALGTSQLKKLTQWLERRRAIAQRYDGIFQKTRLVAPLAVQAEANHAYHLYVVKLAEGVDRMRVFRALRGKGIAANVHYVPVHLHPFYRDRFQTQVGQCPIAEAAYARILSLPLWAGLDDETVDSVAEKVIACASECA